MAIGHWDKPSKKMTEIATKYLTDTGSFDGSDSIDTVSQPVVVLLVSSIKTTYSDMMKVKFEEQQEGYLRWLERKHEYIRSEEKHYKYYYMGGYRIPTCLPIEFANDRESVFSTRLAQELHSTPNKNIKIPAAWKLDIDFIREYGCGNYTKSVGIKTFKSLVRNGTIKRQAIINTLKKRPTLSDFIVRRYGSDKEIVLGCLENICNTKIAIKYLNDELKKDTEVIATIATLNPKGFATFIAQEPNLLLDEHLLVELVKEAPQTLFRLLGDSGISKLTLMKGLSMNAGAYGYLPESLKMDVDIVAAASRSSSLMIVVENSAKHRQLEPYEYCMVIPKKLLSRKRSIVQLIRTERLFLEDVPKTILGDKGILLEIAKHMHDPDHILPSCLLGDRELLLINARKYYRDWYELKKGGLNPKSHRFVLAARHHQTSIGKDQLIAFGSTLDESYSISRLSVLFADKCREGRLRRRRLVLETVATCPAVIEYIPWDLLCDEEIAVAAIHTDPDSIKYFRPTIRGNFDIALTVAALDGCAIKQLPPNLRDNEKLARIALKQNGYAYHYLSKKLRSDPDITIYAIEQARDIIDAIPEELMADEGVVSKMFEYCNKTLHTINHAFKFDKDFILSVITNNPMAVSEIDQSLFNDAKFLEHLIKTDPAVYRYLPINVRNREETLLCVIKEGGWSLIDSTDEFGPEDNVPLNLVRANGNVLYKLNKCCQSNHKLVIEAAKHGGAYFLYNGTLNNGLLKKLYSIRMDTEYKGCYIPHKTFIFE